MRTLLCVVLLVFPYVAAAQCPVPTPPALEGLVSGSTVGMGWSAPDGATRYQIEAGLSPGATDAAVIPTQSRRFSAPVADGRYFVRVRAENDCGRSAPSSEVEIVVPCTEAAPVLALSPAPGPLGRGQSFRVTHVANSETAGYRFEIAAAAHEPSLWSFFSGFNADLGFAWGGPGVYYARLRSVSACGGLLVSNEVAFVLQ